MLFYVYCLSDEVTDRMIESAAGVRGAGEPRLIQCGGVAAVVSELEGERVSLTRENVFAHERVIGRVLAHTTPLPFRFGTVVSAARLETYIDSQREFLQAQLTRVRGTVEMSVKVIWPVPVVKRETLTGGAQEVEPTAEPQEEGLGAAYLSAKRREILGDESSRSEAEETARWLAARLGDAVRETETSVRPLETLVLAVAHMVERRRLEAYRERLRAARLERNQLHFLTSGPWPPYSFVQARS
jgi:hypothetical protein